MTVTGGAVAPELLLLRTHSPWCDWRYHRLFSVPSVAVSDSKVSPPHCLHCPAVIQKPSVVGVATYTFPHVRHATGHRSFQFLIVRVSVEVSTFYLSHDERPSLRSTHESGAIVRTFRYNSDVLISPRSSSAACSRYGRSWVALRFSSTISSDHHHMTCTRWYRSPAVRTISPLRKEATYCGPLSENLLHRSHSQDTRLEGVFRNY